MPQCQYKSSRVECLSCGKILAGAYHVPRVTIARAVPRKYGRIRGQSHGEEGQDLLERNLESHVQSFLCTRNKSAQHPRCQDTDLPREMTCCNEIGDACSKTIALRNIDTSTGAAVKYHSGHSHLDVAPWVQASVILAIHVFYGRRIKELPLYADKFASLLAFVYNSSRLSKWSQRRRESGSWDASGGTRMARPGEV